MTLFTKEESLAEKNSARTRETLRILNLAIARIELAMLEGNEDVESLTGSFVDIVNSARQIDIAASELEDTPVKKIIGDNCQQISQRMQGAIMAFQFYDRLSQRMLQTSKTLSALTEILDNQVKAPDQETWQKLQKTIRSEYTLDADLQLLNDILNGITIEAALKNSRAQPDKDDIEFF